MAFSVMLRRVVLVRTDVSEERSTSIIRATKIGEIGTNLAIISNRRTLRSTANVPSSPIFVALMMEALRSSETSALTRATRRNIPEDAILQITITPNNFFNNTGSSLGSVFSTAFAKH
jgi:hypothetical protein